METYIALLRGVNVGGKNLLSMPRLRTALEAHGFTDVRTYINSGNALFSADTDDSQGLQGICQKIIQDTFQLDIPVAILSAKELEAALSGAPHWWGTDADSKHNAIFVLRPATPETVIQAVGEAKGEYEKIGFCGQVIFWSAPLATFSRTRWIKIISTSAYQSVTIRNANTARKLLALCSVGAAR